MTAKKPNQKIRELYVNDPEANRSKRFATNQVHTTKYTLLTFLPQFLWKELRRPANLFFCLLIVIQIFDPNELDKFSTVIPLSGILAFSAVKEAYEDLKRRNNDMSANNALVKVVRDGILLEIHSKDVKVGDILKVNKGERFPADLVLVSSSEPQGIAYVETSNVDGESNLKIRMSNSQTNHLMNEKLLSEFKAKIQCEAPNEHIYKFEGNMSNEYECFSLEPSNILLRGAVLKNTSWIYGVVIYTGHETKIMMNSSETPHKRTQMDRKTDQQYVYISIGLAILTVVGTIGNWYYDTKILPKHWYLNLPDGVGIKKNWNPIIIIYTMLTYVMLLNTLVPISLSLTLECIKLILAYLVNQDIELYDEDSDNSAVARSSNLMEELGQIQCILTDKTGTLTRNEMILKHLIIEGEAFENCCEPGSKLLNPSEITERIDFFLKVLATCHTVMIDYSDPDNPCYQGSSPDELAMVNVASELNYKFSKRSSGSITIEIRGVPVTIEVFAVIEFTSARKRMSIVALLPDNNYYLFSKGADGIILDRLEEGSKDSNQVKDSLKALEKFASAGLRTLCFAYRKLEKDFALEWLDKWHEALNTVTERQEKIDSVAQLIENNLKFIGATGVEDRLQDSVPETVETLMKANIKIWMLTGDRFETSISTAFLSNLIKASTIQFHLLRNDREDISKSLDNFQELIDKNSANGSNFALVINGAVVEIILSDAFLNSPDIVRFRRIVSKCRTLLCCRLSPLQKSQITRFAREKLGLVTLAIGDGGNDVSMIQAANVGVGISGKEGLQASRSADFSIAQFKFLVKLVLVHGSWSLHRLSRVVMYSIYKNFVLFFCQFWYCFYNSFSAKSIYESWMFVNWNLVYTCWPPTIIGITDQYVFASELIENPQLYEFGQKNKFYDDKTFWRSAINAIFHSFVIFASVNLMFPEGLVLPDGRTSTALMLGSILFAIILNVVCIKILLFTNYMTLVLGSFVVFSAGLWYAFISLHKYTIWTLPNASTYELFEVPSFWAMVLLIPVVVCLRDFLWKFYRRQFCPHSYHIVQELKLVKTPKKGQKGFKLPINLIYEGTNRKPKRNLGFSFSQTFGQSRVLHAYGQSPRLTSSLMQSKISEDDI